MDDPYFMTLAGLMLTGLLFVIGSSVYEYVSSWRKIHHYTSQLPPGEFLPAEALCPILGIDHDRLKDFTNKKIVPRFEAEKIIRDLVTKEWWQL